jgi:O-antigen/teichoic acid export membrane protein
MEKTATTGSRRLFHLVFLKPAEILRSERNRKLVVGVGSGIVVKGMAFIFTMITVPMTLHYLGQERYGVWVTMISLLAWVSLVDIGLANGLTTLLAMEFGKGRFDLARAYIATAFWGLAAIAMIVGGLIAACWHWIDWGQLFNVASIDLAAQISQAMGLAVGIFLLNLPMTITQRIYLANQQGFTANMWQLTTSLAGVLGIYLVTQIGGNLSSLVLGYSGAQLGVGLVNMVWLFGWSKPHLRPFVLPDMLQSKKVMTMGGLFFVNQIATLLVFQKDNILITHYLGPAQAAQYSVVWQMFLYLNVINMLVAPYLGPAFGEAYAKNDLRWMRTVVIRYLLITFGFAIVAVSALSIFYRPIMARWVGTNLIPDLSLVLWMAALSLVLSIQWPIISLLNSTGRLRVFTLVYGFAAFVNLILSLFLIPLVGIQGGVIASLSTLTLIVLLPSVRELLIVLREK